MLHFRAAQQELIRDMQENVFKLELAERLRRYWPERSAALGGDGLRARIDLGMARGRGYGLRSSYDLSRYVYCMMELGDDFDTDPACPFAVDILHDERYDPTTRMDRLVQAAMRHLDERAAATAAGAEA